MMRREHANLYRKAASGAGTLDRLTTNTVEEEPLDWSRDGRFLSLYATHPEYGDHDTGRQRWPAAELPWACARSTSKAQFNPGVPRWIAYDFDDSGRREIYVQAFEPGEPAPRHAGRFPMPGGTCPGGGGRQGDFLPVPGWQNDGRTGFGRGAAFQSSTPQFLFNATPPNLRTPNFEYDVSANGERFLMIEPMEKPEYQPLTLVSNWASTVRYGPSRITSAARMRATRGIPVIGSERLVRPKCNFVTYNQQKRSDRGSCAAYRSKARLAGTSALVEIEEETRRVAAVARSRVSKVRSRRVKQASGAFLSAGISHFLVFAVPQVVSSCAAAWARKVATEKHLPRFIPLAPIGLFMLVEVLAHFPISDVVSQ